MEEGSAPRRGREHCWCAALQSSVLLELLCFGACRTDCEHLMLRLRIAVIMMGMVEMMKMMEMMGMMRMMHMVEVMEMMGKMAMMGNMEIMEKWR